MVNARLHLICGNCGCNDKFEWKHEEEETISNGEELDVINCEDVSIVCNNCSTIHYLSDNAEPENKGEK